MNMLICSLADSSFLHSHKLLPVMYSDVGHKKIIYSVSSAHILSQIWTQNILMRDKVSMTPPKIIRAHHDILLHTNGLFFNGPDYLLLLPPVALNVTITAAIKLRAVFLAGA